MLAKKALKPCPAYERREPEKTPCYQMLKDHLPKFIAAREEEGRPLPAYVIKEFEAYLKCGILSHGFLRLKCQDCQNEKVVAFSCKTRGFCPSCWGKRMAETSEHLLEDVLPFAPYRQFVVSFPFPLRFWLQTNRKLYQKIHSLVIKRIHGFYRKKAESLGIQKSTPGCISFSQRWGSALNLNPHMHVLTLDGVYTLVQDKPRFNNLLSITDDDVQEIISQISKDVVSHLRKQGFLNPEGELVQNPDPDKVFQESEAISLATQSSLSGKIAFGPNAGKFVTRIGSGFGYGEEIPLAKGPLCYSVNGFSLHARTQIKTHQRDQLGRLIEYMARGPLSNDRLEITQKGQMKLTLKTPWSDGTAYLLFSPSEFIEKLCALIPPPKGHLVRWSGCFAPNSPYRKLIRLKPEVKKGFDFSAKSEGQKKNPSWARLLARVFKIDVLACPCGGQFKVIAAIRGFDGVTRYLDHKQSQGPPTI